jgi:uncharacterized RDD family membrane protein YckC
VGTVLSDSLIWRQGMNEWQTLAAVRAANPAWIAERRQANPSIEEPSAAAPTALTPPLALEAPAAESEPVVVYAGFWPRCGAYLVDLFLWWMVWQIFVGIVGTAYFPEAMAVIRGIEQYGIGYQLKPEEALLLAPFWGVSLIIGLIWSIAYDAIFLLRFGATPGKLLLGLRVVQADGRPLGFTRIVLRSLSKSLVCLTLGIGYLIVAFDEHKRGLHDFICNTRVIKKR